MVAEALAFMENDAGRLERLLVAMLGRRDQWLLHPGFGLRDGCVGQYAIDSGRIAELLPAGNGCSFLLEQSDLGRPLLFCGLGLELGEPALQQLASGFVQGIAARACSQVHAAFTQCTVGLAFIGQA